ncbi:hypothetical protein COC42_07015 [Sphingomonas spermidinifaciens]|uniref:Uncharacterized protein n=1 Tax=Sphingomonas spermidinifaciens TaxID=1141889 RepID=A0A2A4B7W6_9SPHN|nr:flagellar hook-length control protein FliK [Sphingomonas spermidinifaciens]PCD04052.1 hypothetical protein COC42_07015 [Sphingomonas spermidinifaciens]
MPDAITPPSLTALLAPTSTAPLQASPDSAAFAALLAGAGEAVTAAPEPRLHDTDRRSSIAPGEAPPPDPAPFTVDPPPAAVAAKSERRQERAATGRNLPVERPMPPGAAPELAEASDVPAAPAHDTPRAATVGRPIVTRPTERPRAPAAATPSPEGSLAGPAPAIAPDEPNRSEMQVASPGSAGADPLVSLPPAPAPALAPIARIDTADDAAPFGDLASSPRASLPLAVTTPLTPAAVAEPGPAIAAEPAAMLAGSTEVEATDRSTRSPALDEALPSPGAVGSAPSDGESVTRPGDHGRLQPTPAPARSKLGAPTAPRVRSSIEGDQSLPEEVTVTPASSPTPAPIAGSIEPPAAPLPVPIAMPSPVVAPPAGAFAADQAPARDTPAPPATAAAMPVGPGGGASDAHATAQGNASNQSVTGTTIVTGSDPAIAPSARPGAEAMPVARAPDQAQAPTSLATLVSLPAGRGVAGSPVAPATVGTTGEASPRAATRSIHRAGAPRAAVPPAPADAPTPVRVDATDRLLRARPNTAFSAEPAPIDPAISAAPTQPSIETAAAPAIDTQHRDWRTQMLARIDSFTAADPAPGRETRITLSPDALGEVAVRLRETDRGIEVVLDAAPEARALLAEAAPRLTELAESRGLRLSLQQPGAGDGGTGDRPQPQQRHAPDTPTSNRRAARADADTPTDERIA